MNRWRACASGSPASIASQSARVRRSAKQFTRWRPSSPLLFVVTAAAVARLAALRSATAVLQASLSLSMLSLRHRRFFSAVGAKLLNVVGADGAKPLVPFPPQPSDGSPANCSELCCFSQAASRKAGANRRTAARFANTLLSSLIARSPSVGQCWSCMKARLPSFPVLHKVGFRATGVDRAPRPAASRAGRAGGIDIDFENPAAQDRCRAQ